MTFDTSAFTRPMTRAEEASGPRPKLLRHNFGIAAVPGGLGVALLTIWVFRLGKDNSESGGELLAMALLSLAMGVFFALITLDQGPWTRRLMLFAEDNGFSFQQTLPDPPYGGTVFRQGKKRLASKILRRGGAQPIEVGTFQYSPGSRFNSPDREMTYIRLPLSTPLPHVFAELQEPRFRAHEIKVLPFVAREAFEGGVSVDLHAPPGYADDAAAIFGREELGVLANSWPHFDAETIGAELYLYAHSSLMLNEQGWRRIDQVLQELQPSIQRWKTWRDLRPAATAQQQAATSVAPEPFAAVGGEGWYMPPGVAPQGERMRERLNLANIVPLVIVLFVSVGLGVAVSYFL